MPTPIPPAEYPTLVELINITYQDRLEKLLSAQLQDDGDTVIALGQDGIKRIAVKITSDTIELKLLNPEDIIDGDESEDEDPSPTFSLSDRLDAPPDPIADITTTLRPQASNLIADWLQAIQEAIATTSSLDEVGDRLMALYPDLPSGELARLMADATTIAGMAGYYEAVQDADL